MKNLEKLFNATTPSQRFKIFELLQLAEDRRYARQEQARKQEDEKLMSRVNSGDEALADRLIDSGHPLANRIRYERAKKAKAHLPTAPKADPSDILR